MLEWIKFWERGNKKALSNQGWNTVYSQANAEMDNGKETGDPQDTYATWVAKCVTVNANVFASTPLNLYRTDTSGKKTMIQKHAVLDLLNDVNDYMTRYELFWYLSAHLALYGNAYWFITRNKNGEPFEITPLNPSRVSPVGDTKTFVKEFVFQPLEGDPIPIPKENIIHFKNYSPFNFIKGLSTIENSLNIIYTDKYATVWNKNFFKNSAIPGIVIKTPGTLQKPDIKRIRDSWVQEYGGTNRAGKPAVLHSGTDISVIQSTLADMQMIELRSKNRDDVAAMFGVPLVLLGDLSKVTYASARVAEYIHDKVTNNPACEQTSNILNEFLLTMFTNTKGLGFARVPPQMLDQEVDDRLEKQFTNKIITVNEWRGDVGRMPIPGGDRYAEDAPVSTVVAPQPGASNDQTKQDPKASGATTPPTDGNSANDASAKKLKTSIEKSIKKHATKDAQPIMSDQVARDTVDGSYHPANSMQLQMHWEQQYFEMFGAMESNKKRIREDGHITSITDALMKLFQRQSDEAVKQVDDGMKALKPGNILDPKKHIKATIDLMSPFISNVIEQEARDALTKIEVDPNKWTVESPSAKDYLKNGIEKMATVMTDTMITAVRSAIADGLDAGEGIKEISARIESLKVFSRGRAELIALTETHRASSFAELEAFKQSKVVVNKIWYTAKDERTCPLCAPMHGVEIPLNSPFLTVSQMEDLGLPNYDGSIKTAMMHPRCRCVIIPVLKA